MSNDDPERLEVSAGMLLMPAIGLLMLICVLSAAISLIAMGYDGPLPLWAGMGSSIDTDVDDDLRYALRHWKD